MFSGSLGQHDSRVTALLKSTRKKDENTRVRAVRDLEAFVSSGGLEAVLEVLPKKLTQGQFIVTKVTVT